MTIKYLKKANTTPAADQGETRDKVQAMLTKLEQGRDKVASEYSKKFDNWDGAVLVTKDELQAAESLVAGTLKEDIQFAHDNIKRFAEAQMATSADCAIEVRPGFTAGQKQIPMSAAGCYVPGGRYSHIASAIMTITTAKVANVGHIMACSPPKPGVGIPPAILYTMNLCGADSVLNMGGVQGIACMAYGLFDLPQADILVGPGNQYVAEAKRLLFGRLGIDMFAGPTDSMVVADQSADPKLVAWDLVGQAEHGYNSPVWLVTDDHELADAVAAMIPDLISQLPRVNAESAAAAWQNLGEIILCTDREMMARVCNEYAPEHLHIQACDLDWWLERLSNYGSLFLGEETTVAYGDKAAGTNHVLPTSGAARYTGGLSVHKFQKTVTWQRATREGTKDIAQATARISRLEGMEGHARTADMRLAKYFPDEIFNLSTLDV